MWHMSPEGPLLLGVKRIVIIDFKRAGWDSGWEGHFMLHPPKVQRNSSPLKNGGFLEDCYLLSYWVFWVTFAGGPRLLVKPRGGQFSATAAACGTTEIPEDFAEVDPFELHTWHLRFERL